MKIFQEKTAVITGAASGIGLALTEKSLQEGMNVVLADIEEGKLKEVEEKFSKYAHKILSVKTDVSKLSDIEQLAEKTLNVFQGVHLLFNNAGVSSIGSSFLETTIKDWQWVLGVNLWGVVYGVHVFLPLMLKQNQEGHIVNTASMAGLLSSAYMSPYNVSKHAVVTLSETLYLELKQIQSRINVSVLCPGLVKTNIIDAGRNRPQEFQNDPELEEYRFNNNKKFNEWMTRSISKGLEANNVAEMVFDAIKNETFYIITHEWIKKSLKIKMENILTDNNPVDP